MLVGEETSSGRSKDLFEKLDVAMKHGLINYTYN